MDVSTEPPVLTTNSSSASYTARPVTPWPARLVDSPLGDPFFFGTTPKSTPIVFDFGSHRLRGGFANEKDPFCT